MSGTGEKTQEATPEKLRKSKEEGQVPKSQDFVGAFGFGAGFFVLALLLTYVFDIIVDFTTNTLQTAFQEPKPERMVDLWKDSLVTILKATLPVGVAVMVMGVFSNVVQTGFFISFKVLTPKLDKINPVNGFKNLFKLKKFVELLKNVLKMAAAGWIAWDVVAGAMYDISLTVTLPLKTSASYAGGLVSEYLIKTTALFVTIGALDLIWSRRVFAKEQMMSKHDVKQEYKQQEGDPQFKGHRRQFAHEIIFGGGAQNVKNADAVIVNPTHIAVAIKYDKDKTAAPTVVAKGMELHAEKIKELAREYGVPILRNVPLAHALNRLDVGDEIPEELYDAVAEVLTFVMKLKDEEEAKKGGKPQATAAKTDGPDQATDPKQPEVGKGADLLKRKPPDHNSKT